MAISGQLVAYPLGAAGPALRSPIQEIVDRARAGWLVKTDIAALVDQFVAADGTPLDAVQWPGAAAFQSASGDVFIFNRTRCRFNRRDGYDWNKKMGNGRIKIRDDFTFKVKYEVTNDKTMKRRCHWRAKDGGPRAVIIVIQYLSSCDGESSPDDVPENDPTYVPSEADSDDDSDGDRPPPMSAAPGSVAVDHEMAEGPSEVNPGSSLMNGAHVLGQFMQDAYLEKAMPQVDEREHRLLSRQLNKEFGGQQPGELLRFAEEAGAEDLSEQLGRVNTQAAGAAAAATEGEQSVAGGRPLQFRAPSSLPEVSMRARVDGAGPSRPFNAQQPAGHGAGQSVMSHSEATGKTSLKRKNDDALDGEDPFVRASRDYHRLRHENGTLREQVAELERQLETTQAATDQQVHEALAAAEAQHAEVVTGLQEQLTLQQAAAQSAAQTADQQLATAQVETAAAQTAAQTARQQLAAVQTAAHVAQMAAQVAAQAAAQAAGQSQQGSEETMEQTKQEFCAFMARYFGNGAGPSRDPRRRDT